MKKLSLIFSIILCLLLAGCTATEKYTGGNYHNATIDFSEGVSVDGTTIISGTGAITGTTGTFSGAVSGTTGTFSSNTSVGGDLSVTGTIIGDYKVAFIAATNQYSTTTLTVADSGTVYAISASGTTITLPAVTATGTHFKFIINGAIDTGNVLITSAAGDDIEGSVIVAGAVVDCNAADVLTFVADGENIGDFVEVISTGKYWVPLQSGALSGSKLTCSG